MIKNIIFDIGNVMVDFCWEDHLHSFGFTREIEERVAGATVLADAWNEFDRGALSQEELMDAFVRNDPEIGREIRQVCGNIRGMLRRREYAVPWVKELKAKGCGVYYLSNFSEKAERECADTIDFIPYMDGGILSYREKLIKPEPEIYKLLLARYDLKPAECVFLDDKEENCAAARALGIAAIRFTTREKAIEELKKLGID